MIYSARRRMYSFPLNKYIISSLQKGLNLQVEWCKEHNRELVVFCDRLECKKPICVSCMVSDHKNHDVRDIRQVEEEMRKELLENANRLGKKFSDLQGKKMSESFETKKGGSGGAFRPHDRKGQKTSKEKQRNHR